jgi:hypothetical protein
MKIQIDTDSSVEASEALVQTIETTVHDALDRYGDRLTRVEVHLGGNGGAGDDQEMRCLLEARPSGMEPVVVTGAAETPERACHDATRKMQRLLESTFGRISSRDGDATIRHQR